MLNKFDKATAIVARDGEGHFSGLVADVSGNEKLTVWLFICFIPCTVDVSSNHGLFISVVLNVAQRCVQMGLRLLVLIL